MLVGDVEVSYGHPPQNSATLWTLWNQFFSIDFYALSDGTCYQKQITGNIVKISIFNMAAMKKCRKLKKMGIYVILTITDKQNLHINVIVESYNEISL